MFKITSRDKDLLLTIVSIAVTFGVMLALIRVFGELHGLISTVALLIVQTSFLSARVAALERKLRISHERLESQLAKIENKTV